jgi:hypothetical protein
MVTGFEFDRGKVIEALMRSDLVVVAAPRLDDGFCLGSGAEPFHGKALVAQLAVKAFISAVLPRFARVDVGGVDGFAGEPFEDSLADEFGAIVGAQMGRRTVDADQPAKHFDDAPRTDGACHINGQAFAGELVDQRQALELLAVGATGPCERRRGTYCSVIAMHSRAAGLTISTCLCSELRLLTLQSNSCKSLLDRARLKWPAP